MQPRDSTTKYIVPLFGGRELFDRIIPFVDERQRDFLWDVGDVSDAPEHTIKVFSPVFFRILLTRMRVVLRNGYVVGILFLQKRDGGCFRWFQA